MKDGLCGKHFTDDDAVILAINKWLLEADSNFYERGMQAFIQQWRKCVQSGEYMEK
jgi:ADP-ribosylglycohydrolase